MDNVDKFQKPKITNIFFYGKPSNNFVCYVSIELDNNVCVRDLKIIKLKEKMLLAMPSKSIGISEHRDILYPINKDYRIYLETEIFRKFIEKQDKEGVNKERKL